MHTFVISAIDFMCFDAILGKLMSQWELPMDTFDAFRLWLHRPLVDLGDAPATPTFLVHAIELDYRSMVESSPRRRIQVSINHSFRGALATAIGRPEFDVRMSGELPVALRSERWSILCDFVESWDGLPPEYGRRSVTR